MRETRFKLDTAETYHADMSKFDPSRRRKSFEDFGIQYALNIQYDSSRPMGSVGLSQLELTIGAWIVGLEKETALLVPRALEWINGAIEGGEVFGESPDYHMQNLCWGKAIALWMLDDSTEVQAWEQARQHHAAAAEESLALINEDTARAIFSKTHFTTYRLDDYLALCIGAQQYELGVEEFEKYHGPAPLKASQIKKPREFGYLSCMQILGREYDVKSVFRAGRQVLRAHLDSDWLSKGQFIRAATWLKVVYSSSGEQLTPLQTLLKAHDYL